MPKDLYNLGRVVGMSAWEVYVRQSLLLNPDIEPLSEREWLSDSIGMGTSMLLKISAGTTKGYHDYPLPDNSLLCAPNTIIGSFFNGSGGGADERGWCDKVTSYGSCVDPDSLQGNVDKEDIPHKESYEISDESKKQLMQYIKIQDAVFLQTGTWSDSGAAEGPSKTFLPDLTDRPILRIIFQEDITTDFYILLTGFVTSAIVKGEIGYDLGAVIPDDESDRGMYHPENGDYLGPELFPWASKVVFTYPGILTWLLLHDIDSTSHH